MPGRRRGDQGSSEYFRFAVETWDLDYGFHVNASYDPQDRDDPLGGCWERHDLVISGPLRSKTRRRCERVTLNLSPGAVEPKDWKQEWKGFGRVVGVRDGALTGYARLPTGSFHSVVTALAAGKVRGLYLGVSGVVRGEGVIYSLFTIDPDDRDE